MQDKRNWWAILTNNLWAKGMAIGLAGLLWVALAGQQSSEIAMTIPVEYQQIAPTIELRGRSATRGKCPVTRLSTRLEAMRSRPVRARVSLAQVRDGINYFLLTKNQIDLPAGVEITEIRPALLLIEVQKKEAPARQPSSDGLDTRRWHPFRQRYDHFRVTKRIRKARLLNSVESMARKSRLRSICST